MTNSSEHICNRCGAIPEDAKLELVTQRLQDCLHQLQAVLTEFQICLVKARKIRIKAL